MSAASVSSRKFGAHGPLNVSRIGYGAMSLSFYKLTPDSDVDAAESALEDSIVAYIEACAQAGVLAHLDTALIYTGHKTHSEVICGRAIKRVGREKVFLATKGSIDLPTWKNNSSDEGLRAHISASLARLDVDCIDLYYEHRRDTATPVADMVATMKALVAEGKIKHVGMSECTPAELREAAALHPIAAVQIEWSLQSRDVEAALVPACREVGAAIVCYSPLGRGFLAQAFTKRDDLAADDWRLTQPRYSAEHFAENAQRAGGIKALADARGVTPAPLALAWLLAQGDDVFPIPGTKAASRALENLAAGSLALAPAEAAAVAAAVPEADGDRYTNKWGQYDTRM